MQLYNYFRSSASYRVRIALALKGLDYDYRAVHLVKNEQFNESYAAGSGCVSSRYSMIASDCVSTRSPSTSVGTRREAETAA